MLSSIDYNFREVSKRLISARTQNGLTQQKLASKLGVSLQTIKNYEKAGSQNTSDPTCGDRLNAISGMNIETLFKIAKELHVSTDYLLGLSDISTPDLTVREIHKMTSLSEKNITALIDHGPYGQSNLPYMVLGFETLVNDLVSYASTYNATRTYSRFFNIVNTPEPPMPQPLDGKENSIISYKVVAEVISGVAEKGVDYAQGYTAIDSREYSEILLEKFLNNLKVYLYELYFSSDEEAEDGND